VVALLALLPHPRALARKTPWRRPTVGWHEKHRRHGRPEQVRHRGRAGDGAPRHQHRLVSHASETRNPHAQLLLEGRIREARPVRGQLRMVRPAAAWLQPLPFHIEHSDPSLTGAMPQIRRFWSPSMDNPQGKVRWRGIGDTVRFEMQVQYEEERAEPPFAAAVRTDIDDGTWRDYPMQLVGRAGDQLTYAADLSITQVRTYRATGVLYSGRRSIAWLGHDLVFRPYDVSHDRQTTSILSIPNLGTDGRVGTFEDVRGTGTWPRDHHYSLRQMRARGITAVRIQPIHGRPWSGAGDTSPYASDSLFDVWTELSEPARRLRAQLEALRAQPSTRRNRREMARLERRMFRAAILSFVGLIDDAHALGMKVFADVSLGHTARDTKIEDIRFYGPSGEPIDLLAPDAPHPTRFEIWRNDPRQLASGLGQMAAYAAEMEDHIRRLVGSGTRPTLQRVAPFLYGSWGRRSDGSWGPRPQGAWDPREIADGGWAQWIDAAQLNTGAAFENYHFWDYESSPQSLALRALNARRLLWLGLGVDGLRIDYAPGLPRDTWLRDLNLVARSLGRIRPGLSLYLEAEAYHRQELIAPMVDTLENGQHHAYRTAYRPSGFRAWVDESWLRNSPATLGNHDEPPAAADWGPAWMSYAQRLLLLDLLGRPSLQNMAAEFGEQGGHRAFMNPLVKLATLQELTPVSREMQRIIARGRRARQNLPALHAPGHDWLPPAAGWDRDPDDVLAFSRFDESRPRGRVAIVLANFHGDEPRAQKFGIPPRTAARLSDGAHYMALNYGNPREPLWDRPRTGAEIKRDGIEAELSPAETKVVDLRPVDPGNGFAPRRYPRKRKYLEVLILDRAVSF
jgi:hypothetical protein